jgi:hypothetical protein
MDIEEAYVSSVQLIEFFDRRLHESAHSELH